MSTHYSTSNSQNLDDINTSQKEVFNPIFQNRINKMDYMDEYLEETFYNLLDEEKHMSIKPIYGYITNQKDINEQMRAILVDWIIEVHFNFNLKQETLYLTIWIIDTYLSFEIISRSKLQLLGIAAFFISCKYNEVLCPRIIDFINITDNAYEVKELLEIEQKILKKLDFNILVPTPLQFYDILAKIFNFDNEQYYLGKYFMDSNLIDYNMISYPSSIIALSCAYIVMKYYNIKDYYLLYNINDKNHLFKENLIKKAAKQLCFFVNNLNQTNLISVKQKYSLDKFCNVSKLCQ